MKSSKTFNNISDKLRAKLAAAKLKPGQSVVIQMMNGVPNPEPDEKERSKDPILYPKVQLLTKYRIYDDGQKDEGGNIVGGYVDVGLVDSWKGDEPIAFRCFVTGSNPSSAKATMPSRFQGKFELRGGNVREEELYEILFLSPQRKGTPCPDDNVEQVFKFVDHKAEATQSVTRFNILEKAIKYCKEITAEKANQVMLAMRQPTFQDEAVLMAKVKDIARDKPEDFIKAYESADTPTISLIREALAANVLSYDLATGKVNMGAVEIATVKAGNYEEFPETFAAWMKTSDGGNELQTNISSQVKAAKNPVKK